MSLYSALVCCAASDSDALLVTEHNQQILAQDSKLRVQAWSIENSSPVMISEWENTIGVTSACTPFISDQWIQCVFDKVSNAWTQARSSLSKTVDPPAAFNTFRLDDWLLTRTTETSNSTPAQRLIHCQQVEGEISTLCAWVLSLELNVFGPAGWNTISVPVPSLFSTRTTSNQSDGQAPAGTDKQGKPFWFHRSQRWNGTDGTVMRVGIVASEPTLSTKPNSYLGFGEFVVRPFTDRDGVMTISNRIHVPAEHMYKGYEEALARDQLRVFFESYDELYRIRGQNVRFRAAPENFHRVSFIEGLYGEILGGTRIELPGYDYANPMSRYRYFRYEFTLEKIAELLNLTAP